MANMLRKSSGCSWSFGCCSRCARGTKRRHRPAPAERHQARAIEKRQWKKEIG